MNRKHIYIAMFSVLVGVLIFVASRPDEAPADRMANPRVPTQVRDTAPIDETRGEAPDEKRTATTQGRSVGPRWGIYDDATLGAPVGRRLAGWVTDPNGEPVVDVVVTVRYGAEILATQLSDEEGRFHFDAINPSAVRISADGGPLGFTSIGIRALAELDAIQMTLESIGWIQAVASNSSELGAARESLRVHITSETDELNEERDFGTPFEDSEASKASERWFNGDEGHYLVSHLVAHGPLGARLAVKAGLTYSVCLTPTESDAESDTEQTESQWVDCGQVRVLPGETAAVDCTPGLRDATITGRLVTTRGEGVEGIKMILSFPPEGELDDDMEWANPSFTTTTDARGEFSFKIARRLPTLGDLSTEEARSFATAQRRQVGIRPGAVTSIGDVLVLRESEVPIGWLDEDFGGIGGLVSLTERGVYLIDVEDDCPLSAAGVEAGDVITQIDGLDAAEMAMPEILKRLRGNVGTAVTVAVRNPMGETWDLNLTRGVMRAASSNWPRGGPTHDDTQDSQPIYDFEAIDIEGELPPE